MKVLKLKPGDEVKIRHGGEELVVKVVEQKTNWTRVGFDAPQSFTIRLDKSNKKAK